MEFRAPGEPILVLDAGTGIRVFGQHLSRRGPISTMMAPPPAAPTGDQALHLFLSHRHADHVQGLPHFAPLHTRTHRVHIHGEQGNGTDLAALIAALVSPPLFPHVDGLVDRMPIHDWPSDGANVGGFRVHRFAANHPGGAAIIRVDDALGPIAAYAPDNELALEAPEADHRTWLASLRAFLHRVPLLVHDAMYREDELAQHRGWGHSSSLEAVRLAMDCEVRTLVLFHHHPDRDDDALDGMVDEARNLVRLRGGTLRLFAAWEGLTLSV